MKNINDCKRYTKIFYQMNTQMKDILINIWMNEKHPYESIRD